MSAPSLRLPPGGGGIANTPDRTFSLGVTLASPPSAGWPSTGQHPGTPAIPGTSQRFAMQTAACGRQ